MNHLFIVTSAIKTKFGKFTEQERVYQTINTLKSIKQRIPNAKIIVAESSALPIDKETSDTLCQTCTAVFNYSGDVALQKIYNATENWDIIKNLSELMSMSKTLATIRKYNLHDQVDWLHKISGRYELNDFFDLNRYHSSDKIMFSPKRDTYIHLMGHKPLVNHYYNGRLWSWPRKYFDFVEKFYYDATTEFKSILLDKNYLDTEHLFFKLIPKELIQEVPFMGVEGLVGHHAKFLKD